MTQPEPILLDLAADAALALAADRPWSQISLLDIADRAQVNFAALYAQANGKAAVMDHLSGRFDRAALMTAAEPAEVHDRLFDAVMARIEAMEPHRHALIAISREEGPAAMAPRLIRTAKLLLETSGIDTGGVKGLARCAAMTAVWTRVIQVWRDDDGALNRTMAEIDQRLKAMSRQLARVGAGF
jgi:AcrR family transcriptional regulator